MPFPRPASGLIAAVLLAGLAPVLHAAAPQQAPAYSLSGTITMQDRIRAQTEIEKIYYRQRLWPKENPVAKPPFEVMIPAALIEKKATELPGLGQQLSAPPVQGPIFEVTNEEPPPPVITPGPQQHDSVRQLKIGILPMPTATSFEGLSSFNTGYFPPDPNGDVGPNHYVQGLNRILGIYDKNSGLLLNAVSFQCNVKTARSGEDGQAISRPRA